MIKENLTNLLDQLGLTWSGQSSKTISGATLTVDWKKGEISYPDDLVINERQTCNFSADENFVVLEYGQRRVPVSFCESLEIALPPPQEQRRMVAEVAAEQRAIAAAPARKQAILEKYL